MIEFSLTFGESEPTNVIVTKINFFEKDLILLPLTQPLSVNLFGTSTRTNTYCESISNRYLKRC